MHVTSSASASDGEEHARTNLRMRVVEDQTDVLLLESKLVYGAYPEFDNVARGWREWKVQLKMNVLKAYKKDDEDSKQ